MNPWDNDPVVQNDQPWASDPVAGAPPPSPSLKDTAIDMAKSGARGLAEGAAGVAGMGGDAISVLDRAFGGNAHMVANAARLLGITPPNSAEMNAAFSAPTGGYHQPQTTAGKYAESVASFVPAAFGGEASLGARAARVALPGLGSEAAGQATAGTPAEPYARAAGGLFGASAPLAVSALASGAAKVLPRVLGGTTGVGTRAVQEAYRAGSTGGAASDAFTGAMRSETPSDAPVGMMDRAVGAMRGERGKAYRSDMSALSQDNHILDFAPIDSAIAKLDSVGNFKGVDISQSTAGVRGQIKDAVDFWKTLPPDEYHTPEGFDALKQHIQDIGDTVQPGSRASVVVKGATDAVKAAIVKQSPAYAKTMQDYSKASDILSEMRSEMSAGAKNPNTALRKLQSTMRDNVNTSWGKRGALLDTLAQYEPSLPPTLAGQALSNPLPRGLARYGSLPIAAAALGITHPEALPALAFMSPRFVGEAAHGMGATARALRPALKPLAHGYRRGLFGSIPLSLSPMMAQ